MVQGHTSIDSIVALAHSSVWFDTLGLGGVVVAVPKDWVWIVSLRNGSSDSECSVAFTPTWKPACFGVFLLLCTKVEAERERWDEEKQVPQILSMLHRGNQWSKLTAIWNKKPSEGSWSSSWGAKGDPKVDPKKLGCRTRRDYCEVKFEANAKHRPFIDFTLLACNVLGDSRL